MEAAKASTKVKKIREKKMAIDVVSLEWFINSVKAGALQNVEEFLLV